MALHMLTTSEGDGAGHRAPDLDAIAANLKPGQWVRVEWVNKDDDSHGVIEGTLRRPAHLAGTLFVGENSFCLRLSNGHVNIHVTAIETTPRPPVDLDEMADLFEVYTAARDALDAAPLGRFGTGSNDAEQNALYVAEQVVRDYLGSHR